MEDVRRCAARTGAEVAPSFELGYRTAGGQARVVRVERGVAHPADAARELGLVVARSRTGDVWRVRVSPATSTRVTRCDAAMRVDLAGAGALYLNGYNSWTDSVERPPAARMRGLVGTPRLAVRRWVLDGSGDYRFTRADPRAGHQHGFGYGYLRFGERVLLVGSLGEDTGFTTLREDLRAGTLTLAKEPPARELVAGQTCELMAFAACEGTLDEAVARWLSLAGVTPRPARPLVGFSSWYRHYGDIDAEKLSRDLAGVAQLLDASELGGVVDGVFQVDDGYAPVGDWTRPHADRFPGGMAGIAADIHARGLLAGLWMAPFVCERDSRLFGRHPDWLLRDAAGRPVRAGSHWSGSFALDTRCSGVREHVREALGTATDGWGFDLLKLDFLYAACLLPHDGLNRGELMADALALVREAVGDGVRLDLCGVPLASALGRAEYCRVGCDVGLSWAEPLWIRPTDRERVSTRRSLANTRGRAHLDGRAFRADPDVFFLRRDVAMTDAQRAELLRADATLGAMLLTSDDVAAWDDAQRAAFAEALATFVRRAR